MTTNTIDEDSQWNEACSWIQDQVLISFRHKTITSRLNNAVNVIKKLDEQKEEEAEPALPECMLVIELPPELRPEETYETEPGSVAQLKKNVIARLKHLEEMESIEEQVRMQKEQRSKLGKLRIVSPRTKNGNTPSKTSAKRRSSSE